MERFEIQPVYSSALPDVAGFIHRWRKSELRGSLFRHRAQESSPSIERRLRWLLLDNPAATEGSPLGYCLRDSTGVIRGLTLCFPAAFLSADQRLLGLCAGSFFIEPPARPMGFYLFKKYLSSPGYSFFLATTCNPGSAALWRQLGGYAVAKSDTEYVLPLRLDGLLPGYMAGKTSSRIALGVARFFGQCANPMWKLLTRPCAKLTIQPCQDWEKLSELSRRHRSANHIASDRSVEFLQWRYGPGSPLHPCDVYLFRDRQGNEGWFSLNNLIRGEEGEFRGAVLLDAIWPREKMNFRGILQELIRLASPAADAIFLRSQPGLDYRECSPFAIPYKLPAPRVFVKMRNGASPLTLDSLDYDDSDYGAWRFRWTAHQSSSASEHASRSSAVRNRVEEDVF